MPMISGTLLDLNGSGVSRTLRAYRRDTGELLGSAQSSGITGAYSITTAYTGEVQIVMLDDTAGTIENDQILRTIPV